MSKNNQINGSNDKNEHNKTAKTANAKPNKNREEFSRELTDIINSVTKPNENKQNPKRQK